MAGKTFAKNMNMDAAGIKTPAVYEENVAEWMMKNQVYVENSSGIPIALALDSNGRLQVSVKDAVSLSGSSVITNQTFKLLDGFETASLANWDVIQNADDIIEARGNSAGASYVNISKGLGENTETSLLSKFSIKGPLRIALGMSLSQRKMQEVFKIEMVEVNDNGVPVHTMAVPAAVAISSISQTATTATVTTATAHGLVPGDRVLIYGVSTDSRLSLGQCIVAAITSPLIFTVGTFFDTTAITTLSSSATVGYIQKVDPLDFYDNAFGVGWVGATATYAKFASRSNKSAFLVTGQTSVASTAATVGNAAAMCDSLQQTADYDLRFKNEGIICRTISSDAIVAPALLAKRTRVIPDVNANYKIRISATNIKEKSRPVAKIVSIVKAGSTTATVNTATTHGLTTGDYVVLYGSYDQTNNIASVTPVAVVSTPTGTSFTCVWGLSATSTVYGGSVIKVTGQLSSTAYGAILPAIQSITVDANYITIVVNTTMAGLVGIAETVELTGIYQNTGTDLTGYDGVYKVANVSTTTLTLYNKELKTGLAKTIIGTTTCGGAIHKRTDLSLHTLRVFDYTRHTVDIDAGNGNYTDVQEAVPVAITAGGVTLTSTTVAGIAAHDSAISGSPVRIAARALNTNYTAVSTGDTADLITTLLGALIQKPYSIPEADFSYAPLAAITGVTDLQIKNAPGVGLKNYLTALQYQNTSAVATEIAVKETAQTSVAWTRSTTTVSATLVSNNLRVGDLIQVTVSSDTSAIPLGYYSVTAAGSPFTFTCLNAGGASGTITYQYIAWKGYAPASMALPVSINFDIPIRNSMVNQALFVTCATTGTNTYVNVQGYAAP